MNKQILNISERDKKLLKLLTMLIAAFLSYYFILNPALENAGMLQSEYTNAKTEYNRAEKVIEMLPELKKEEVSQKKLIQEKYKQFIYEINEARILFKLNATMAEAAFPVELVSFTRATANEITVDTFDYQPLTYPLYDNAAKTNPLLKVQEPQNEKADQVKDNKKVIYDAVAYTDITLEFSNSSYESVFNFLKKLETLDRSIIVKHIKLDGGIEGQIVLSVYSLAKPVENESADLEFDLVLPKGKANPFL